MTTNLFVIANVKQRSGRKAEHWLQSSATVENE